MCSICVGGIVRVKCFPLLVAVHAKGTVWFVVVTKLFIFILKTEVVQLNQQMKSHDKKKLYSIAKLVSCLACSSLIPRSYPHVGKRVRCTSSDFLGHVILIIGMATHCLVCGSHMQQQCGLICAAGALSHHAVNLIGMPEMELSCHADGMQ